MDKTEQIIVCLLIIFLLEVLVMAQQFDGPDYSPQKTEVTLRPFMIFPSGRMILTDDFEATLVKWQGSGDAGGSISRDTAVAESGEAALQIKTVATNNKAFLAQRFFGGVETNRLGIEFNFTLLSGSDSKFTLTFQYFDGTNNNFSRIRYGRTEGKWFYADSNNDLQEVPNGEQSIFDSSFCWNRFKLIIDVSTGKYVQLKVNDQVYDLSALSFFVGPSGTAAHGVIQLQAKTGSASASTLRIDNVTITEED